MARTIAVSSEAFEGQGDFQPIPAGTKLKVSIYDIKEGVSGPNSKKPGSPQFEYTAKVTEEGPYRGREIRYNYVPLDGNASNAWVLVQFATAVGWKAESGSGIEVPDNLNDVLGTEVIAKISQKKPDDQGRIFNQVQGVFKLPKSGEGGGTPPQPQAPVTWDTP